MQNHQGGGLMEDNYFNLDSSDIPLEDSDNRKQGKIIQDALLEEILKCTPFARTEATISCRFDAIMYLPDETKFFAEQDNKPLYCLNQKGKTRCYEKYNTALRKCAITYEEQEQMRKERNLSYRSDVPAYRYNNKEYLTEQDLLKSNIKNEIKCESDGCEYYQKQIQNSLDARKRWGFMKGLHVFEIKSNKDKFDLLQHQIPNMTAIADYVWLVLGDEMKIPEWLPPYISVMVYHSDTKKFTIIRHYKTAITNPPMYWQAFQDQGFKIKNKDIYAYARLTRNWYINSIFRYLYNDSMPCIDMTGDIKQLIEFVEKNKDKTMKELQRTLFEFEK
jgi:hypothetical protein